MGMAGKLFAHPDIAINKSFFGLSTQVVYKVTGSKLKGDYLEYTVENGKRIQALLSLPAKDIEAMAAEGTRIPSTSNGNIRLDICYAKDRQFAALQVYQYGDFDYHAVSEVRIYDGKEAGDILNILL